MFRHRFGCYLAAVLSPVAALAVRVLLTPWLTETGSYALFTAPVALAAWCGGLGGGTVALVTASVLAYCYLTPPPGAASVASSLGALTVFVVASLPVIGFSEALHRVTRRLEEQVKRSQAADQEKDRMMAVVVHELRNPLASLSNALALLRMKGGEELERPQGMAERSLEQMGRLIDDLMDVSRIARGRVNLHYDSVDLTGLVRELCPPFSAAAQEKGLRFVCRLPEEPVFVFGDGLRLSQIIDNLVMNAVKFTDHGEVVVSLSRRKTTACLEVSDTGVGVSAAALPLIWEPFRQGMVNASRGGLGLGLSVVKGLVELHGGTVTVASPGIGQGSVFTVELPLEAGLVPRSVSS